MTRYPNAARGLHLLFLSEILAIVGAVLSWAPLAGSLLAIAALAAQLAGLYKASADDENYRGALVFVIVSLVISAIEIFLQPGFFLSLLSAIASLLSLLVVFTVCNTTSNLLHSKYNDALAERGQSVVTIYAVCTLVSIVCQALGVIPVINIAAGLVSAAASVFRVIGYVMYLIFLNNSSKVL